MAVSRNSSAGDPEITSSPERPDHQQNGALPTAQPCLEVSDSILNAEGTRSLSGISNIAFCLGITFGVMSLMTAELAYLNMSIWRATAFIATLSLFHFLEFYATARYNPSDAKMSSFLLSANGSAYNVAHASALMEFGLRTWLRSNQRPSWLFLRDSWPKILPTLPPTLPLMFGLTLLALGQGVRTAAMAEAGRSFNHVVQSRKRDDHALVQSGVYRFLRHPSYFGFFWWGLGTQLVLGNHICFLAYAVILWQFFTNRIAKEEQFLVTFFDQDYVRYRERTPVLIPFIR